jgi:hypothetical protein
MREGINCGARIGMRIKAQAAFGADAAPLAKQQGAAEQIRPDFETIEPPFVVLWPDADKGGHFLKEWKLDGGGAGRAYFAAFGH